MKLTAADLARAERLLALVREPGATVRELAALLAEIREEAIVCAVVRVEREFAVRERRVKPGIGAGDPTGEAIAKARRKG